MNPEEIKQKTMTMRCGMVRMLRDREYWTAEDIETLKNEYYAGTSINEIAIMLASVIQVPVLAAVDRK